MTTFRSLDEKLNIFLRPEKNQSSLEEWYMSVYDIELDELEIRDLCRAVRQDLFLENILPIAVQRLSHDIIDGFLYDGELISVLCRLKKVEWEKNINLAKTVIDIIKSSDLSDLNEDILTQIEKFLKMIGDIVSEKEGK